MDSIITPNLINMKKVFLFLFGVSVALLVNADVCVLSDVKLGKGYFPPTLPAVLPRRREK